MHIIERLFDKVKGNFFDFEMSNCTAQHNYIKHLETLRK